MGHLTPWAQSSVLDFAATITAAIVTCLTISGLIGNATLIASVLRQPRLRRSPTYVTLVSLAASDFLSLLFTPLNIYIIFTGGLDSTVCSLYAFSVGTSFMSGANHLMLFSILRYIILVKPFVSIKYLTIKNTVGMCAVIWIISLILNIPVALDLELARYNTASNASVSVCAPQNNWTIYTILCLIAYATIPMAVMAIFHILKVCQLRKRVVVPVLGAEKHQVSTKIVAGILIAFAVSFVPSLMYWAIVLSSGDVILEMTGIGYVLAVFSYMNNAINPLFYFFLCSRIRKKFWCCQLSPDNKNSQGNINLQAVCS